jgi:hypothetical protein
MSKIKNSQRKYILAAVILLVCLITGFAYKAATWSPEDYTSQKASEDRIRSAAFRFPENEPDNPKDEFANVTKLILGESPISSVSYTTELADIKLLSKFTNLQMLHIGHIIYPKKDTPKWMILLAKYGILDVDKRFALDLSPLAKLYNLKTLTINITAIKNIKPLSGLVNLQRLDLNGTNVSDLKPIKNLKNLEYLDLSYTQINNLEPIKGLTNLQTLYTYRTKISDLKPLKELKNMRNLYLSVPKVSDIEPIRGLTNLTNLDLSGFPAIDLELIANFENINWLSLCNTNLNDLEPIKKLKRLEVLSIKNCANITDQQVEDLHKALPNLKIER